MRKTCARWRIGRRAAAWAAVAFGLVLSACADELYVARQALRDGLWGVAVSHAETVLAAGSGEEAAEARLVILESLVGERNWDGVGRRLAEWKDERGDGLEYYRALVRGDSAAAMEILRRGGSPDGCVEARLYEAEMRANSGDRAGATNIWREIAGLTNVGERVLVTVGANLMDPVLLRRAYAEAKDAALRRLAGFRLGCALLGDAATAEEGERLVRALVKDAPDAEGAREAYLALAASETDRGHWDRAAAVYHEAIETWPDLARCAAVQEGRGWTLRQLGRRDEALEAYGQAAELAAEPAEKATALVAAADVLMELGRTQKAMAGYRRVLELHPDTPVAERLRATVRVRELEARGRDLYKSYRFAEAMTVFGEVAAADPSRRDPISFFEVLCLYGQGRDEEAGERAAGIIAGCSNTAVRASAMLWLAKFRYNRREWKSSGRLFREYAAQAPADGQTAEALLWAARAAFADGDYNQAILLTTRLAERQEKPVVLPQALLVQGEALIELARFDEAVLVFERAAVLEEATPEVRARARVLRADALYAMGADNPVRYEAALEAYRELRFGGVLSGGEGLVVSFKIARTLEKLRRMEEAIDQYYTQVALAYREGRRAGERFSEDAQAAFSRAVIRLADEYESRGKDRQAVGVLRLLAESDVPAAEEAGRRIAAIEGKGRFL